MRVYLVSEKNWVYNDSTYSDEGDNPHKIFKNKKTAEDFASSMNIEKMRELTGSGFSSWYCSIDDSDRPVPLETLEEAVKKMGGSGSGKDWSLELPSRLTDKQAELILSMTGLRWYHIVPMEIE